MKVKSSFGDAVMSVILVSLALGGLAAIIHAAFVLAIGTAAADQPLRFFTGAALIALSVILGICFALTGGMPPWRWGQRLCIRIRCRHAQWQKEMRDATRRHLDGLPPDERERQLREIPEESFLHPKNLPYDRVKPGCFD